MEKQKITDDYLALDAIKAKIDQLFDDAFYEFYQELKQKAERAVEEEKDVTPLQEKCEDGEEWYDFIDDDVRDYITDKVEDSLKTI